MVRYLIFFILWFYFMEFIWIIVGFFGKDFSLSMVWIPFSVIFFILSLINVKKFSLKKNKFIIILILISLICLAFISFSINLLINLCIPSKFFVFSFILWVSILILSISLLLIRFSIYDIFLIIKTFLFVNIIVILVSIFIEVITLLEIVPTSVFYINPKYTVIGFSFLDKLWIRNPGIFESGATNASFLFHMLLLLLSLIIFGKEFITIHLKFKRSFIFLLLFLNLVLIFFTFTRRFIAMEVFLLFFVFLLAFFKKKNIKYMLSSFSIYLSSIIFIIYFFPFIQQLFETKSLNERKLYWEMLINNLNNDVSHIIYGFSLLQMILTSKIKEIGFFSCVQFSVIDNIYLAALLYGGVIFFILFLIYLIIVTFLPAYYFFKSSDSLVTTLSSYLFFSNFSFFILGIFGNWLLNLQESFIFWVFNTSILSFLLYRGSKK